MSDHFTGMASEAQPDEPVTINPSVFTSGLNSDPVLAPSVLPNPESPTLFSRAEPSVKIEEMTAEAREIRRAAMTPVNWLPRPLPFASLPTGLCYDVRMRFHAEVKPVQEHHPEDPRRIVYIYNELCQAGLVQDPSAPCPPAGNLPLGGETLYRIPAREATPDEICLVHTQTHYAFVQSTKKLYDNDLVELANHHDSIYFNNLSFLSSTLAVGGAIETCRAVVNGTVKNAIAVIRPPGHHAEIDRTMGFCCFNNVSVAARVCQKEFGDKCRKILILDWDVHHGNGIQNTFYEDPNVLYISLHVYNDGRFYPHGPDGGARMCGEGPGIGKNVNIPWPSQGMGDGDYMYAFQNIVMPIGYEFDPDLVIIAAGFDAAAGDTLGGCFVTPPCYGHMTRMLMSLAKGKLAGGYNLNSISKSALAVTRTLLGEPPDRLDPPVACKAAIDTVHQVARMQSKHWRCMYTADIDIAAKHKLGGERMHDIIRAYQSRFLYDKYKMICLFILRDELSVSFQNQVVATPNYHAANPLLVIFHDPPEILGVPNPSTAKLELHNAWLTDMVKHYIDWAVKQGFGVIDVNIPKHLTGLDDDWEGYVEEDRARRFKATEQLAVYLWENYIEINDSTEIFFMGIGDAYQGLLHILTAREQSRDHVTGVVNVLSENPLRPVTSQTDDYAGLWYHKNSMVFVSGTHLVWSPDRRRPKKKFGNLIKSPQNGLNEMLHAHQQQIQKFILDRVIVAETVSDELAVEKDKTETSGNIAGAAEEVGMQALEPPKRGDIVMTTSQAELPIVGTDTSINPAPAFVASVAMSTSTNAPPIPSITTSQETMDLDEPASMFVPAATPPGRATSVPISASTKAKNNNNNNNNGSKRKRGASQDIPVSVTPSSSSTGGRLPRGSGNGGNGGKGNGNGNGNGKKKNNNNNNNGGIATRPRPKVTSKSPLSVSATPTPSVPAGLSAPAGPAASASSASVSRSPSTTPKISSLLNPAPGPASGPGRSE
ncbi:Arginase/deacetylase [Xylona heveae TC161]|uniref:histone deacetylase n=1 Tax=Xylona heveae (strain CBS 132557 / TC161) TaxID=1328760 RepID=A0A165AJU9_XYLHT|nr:Arginase/deacetylase [Xylona heveae TC161]KZF20599.1 Arginase/deacetylase [Xylona heveae TC161]